MLVYKEIHIKFKNLRLLALSMISLHKPEDFQSKKNEKKYDLVKLTGGSEGAAVFKVTRQKLAIVFKNALKEKFLVYLHLLCSMFWIDKLK